MRTRAGWAALAVALFAALLAYLPLAVAVWHDSNTPGLAATYIAQNPTDAGVYLAWIRQGAEGRFLTGNLFAPGGPPNHTVYLLFWALGRLQAIVHMPIGPFYGAATVLSGLGLLAAVWWLTGRFFSGGRTRLVGFALAALSSGLGWAFVPALGAQSDALPIDFSQPEATTFGSLKTPLFALSQILMVLIVGSLWTATRDRRWRPLLVAVPCAALLANSHTYDVISLGASWLVWLAVGWVQRRRVDSFQAAQVAVVGIAVAIPTALNYVALRETGVLAQRALSPTPAHFLWLVVLGYGLLVPLAGFGFLSGRPPWGEKAESAASPGESNSSPVDHDEPQPYPSPGGGNPRPTGGLVRLLATWATVPLLLQYLPTSIGRKLVMGVHLPFALLAALGLMALIRSERTALRWGVAALFALLPLSSLVMAGEGLRAAVDPDGSIGRDTLRADERRALEWLRENAAPGAVVEPMPRFVKNNETGDWDLQASMLDLMAPGYTGHSVECGHWCETPKFQERLDAWQQFATSSTDDEDRREILREKGIDYLVVSERDAPDAPDLAFGRWRTQAPSELHLIPEASTADVRVYRVAGHQ